ncbi:MAG: signal peptidase I [Parcubacteria group bacterium]
MTLKKIVPDALTVIALFIFFFIAVVMPLVGWSFHHVTSESMVPTLCLGDEHLCIKTDISKVEIGDIIVFSSPNDSTDLTVHRAVSIEKRGEDIFITTKGDANKTPDQKVVTKDNFLGKARGRIPLLGFVLGNKIALMSLLFVLGSALILVILLEKEKRRPTRAEAFSMKNALVILAVIGICAWSMIGHGVTEQRTVLIEHPDGGYVMEKKVTTLLPMEIFLVSDGTLSEDNFLLIPGEEKIIAIESDKKNITLKSGSFLPLLPLPLSLVHNLFKWSPYAVVAAMTLEILIPVGVVIVLVAVKKPRRKERIKRRITE